MKSPLVETLKEALQAVIDADDIGTGKLMEEKFAAAFQKAARLADSGLQAIEQTIAKGEEPREPSRVGFSALGRALGAVKPGEGKRWSAAELTRVCELLATESLPLEPGREALDAFMDAMRSVCLANEPDMIGRQERLCEEWNVRVTEPKE